MMLVAGVMSMCTNVLSCCNVMTCLSPTCVRQGELSRFFSYEQRSCHSGMYENIFSTELVLMLWHYSLMKSGKCVCSFGHREG